MMPVHTPVARRVTTSRPGAVSGSLIVHGMLRAEPPGLQTPTSVEEGSRSTVGLVLVLNDQGLRAGPATRLLLSTSCPATTFTVYVVPCAKLVVGVIVTVSFVGAFQEEE